MSTQNECSILKNLYVDTVIMSVKCFGLWRLTSTLLIVVSWPRPYRIQSNAPFLRPFYYHILQSIASKVY